MNFKIKKSTIHVCLLILIIMVASCATKYGPLAKNGGYSDEKINDRVYKITFQGNTRTSDEKVYKYFMRRAAEVALDNHFQYFTIINAEDITKYITVTSVGAAVTKARVTTLPYSGVSYYPTQYKTIPKHMLVGSIQLFKEGEQPLNAYEVEEILKNIKI